MIELFDTYGSQLGKGDFALVNNTCEVVRVYGANEQLMLCLITPDHKGNLGWGDSVRGVRGVNPRQLTKLSDDQIVEFKLLGRIK